MSALRACLLPPPICATRRATPTLGGEHAWEMSRALAERRRREVRRRWRNRPSARRHRRLVRRWFAARLLWLSLVVVPLLAAAIVEWWLRFFPELFFGR
ncbi:MAG: hypothetical protein JO295_03650 [Verrucomicrobia bacterium]|nr:hypothetical protein [Verrucomicrobiota bacterium]